MPQSAFSRLPNEVAEFALSYLDWQEWLSMGATCRRFREVSASDRLWERDYDRLQHMLGCPETAKDYRSVSVAAQSGLQEPGVLGRFRRSVAWKLPTIAINTSRVLTQSQPGRDKLRLVTVGMDYDLRDAIFRYASGADIFRPGSNRDRTQVLSRFPRRIERSVAEASAMIACLTSHPTNFSGYLEAIEESWAERTSEIPLLVFFPKPKAWTAKKRVGRREAIDALRAALPGVPFRVQRCDVEGDIGVMEGMQWIMRQAAKEQAQREKDGIEAPAPKTILRKAFQSKARRGSS